MPSALMTLDTGRPNFTGRETTEQKVEALNNYVIMLLENLRYILRNLGPENLNNAEMVQWLEDNSDVINVSTVITETLITDELYSNYGEVADLTVWQLRTDYLRARNSAHDIASDINYIYIHNEVIEFITAKVKADAPKVQLRRDGRSFWWTDETYTVMTSAHPTCYPVMVYQYEEQVKGKIAFQSIGGYWSPMFQLGVGDSDAEGHNTGRNIGRIVKDSNGLRLLLTDRSGAETGLIAYADGGVDAPGLLWFGTQAQYDALTPNAHTVYFIEAESGGGT